MKVLAWTSALWFLILDFIGEWLPVTGALLFLPYWIWLLPAFVALALCIVWDKHMWWIFLILIAWQLYGAMQWRPGGGQPEGGITLLTWNRDGGQAAPFFALVKSTKPDVIAVQGGNGWARFYKKNLPEYEIAWTDEFLLLSRFPIISKEPLYLQTQNRRTPLAARFILKTKQGNIAVYNVHLLTPRLALMNAPKSPFGKEPYGGKYWRNRIATARELAEIVEQESHPFLLAGDFNMPGRGHIRRIFTRRFQDTHHKAGYGFGFTFPENQKKPISFFGRWLRLDCIFTSQHWNIRESRVCDIEHTEHAPMWARMKLQ